MKVEFWVNSGANIHSCVKEVIDLEADWNITDEDWVEMSDKEKDDMMWEWATGCGFDIGYREVDE